MTLVKFNKKQAFTLAEVLITLTVIGIVASLTIPTLMNNINDQQFKTAYKRVYSQLDQATKRVISENGGSIKGLCGSSNCYRDVYSQYLNTIKKCSPTELYGNCWNKLGEFKYLNDSIITSWGNEAGLVLNDGSFLFWGHASISDCTNNVNSINVCAEAFIDTNGFKPPNTMGKDIFKIHLLPNKILPNGAGDDFDIATNCSSSGTGHSCGAKYLSE